MDMFQPHDHVYNVAQPQVPGPGSNPPKAKRNLYGCLQVSPRQKEFLLSRRPTHVSQIDFRVPVKLEAIINKAVIGEGLQYYKFNEAGSGCLFWQLELLKRFVGLGWITEEDFAQVVKNVEAFAVDQPSDVVPYPPVQGTFYQPEGLSPHPFWRRTRLIFLAGLHPSLLKSIDETQLTGKQAVYNTSEKVVSIYQMRGRRRKSLSVAARKALYS